MAKPFFLILSIISVCFFCSSKHPVTINSHDFLGTNHSRLSRISYGVQGKVDSTYRFSLQTYEDCCRGGYKFGGARFIFINDTLRVEPFDSLFSVSGDSLYDTECIQDHLADYSFSSAGRKYLLLVYRTATDTASYFDSVEINNVITDTTQKALDASDLPTHL
jgi:hypothetical protein